VGRTRLTAPQSVNKEGNSSLIDLHSGVNQPCSYDDSVTHEYKIKIKTALKIVQKIMPRIELFVLQLHIY